MSFIGSNWNEGLEEKLCDQFIKILPTAILVSCSHYSYWKAVPRTEGSKRW